MHPDINAASPTYPPSRTPPTRSVRGTLVAASLAVMVARIANALPGALNGVFQETFGTVGSQLTWITAAFMIPVVVFELTFGVLGDAVRAPLVGGRRCGGRHDRLARMRGVADGGVDVGRLCDQWPRRGRSLPASLALVASVAETSRERIPRHRDVGGLPLRRFRGLAALGASFAGFRLVACRVRRGGRVRTDRVGRGPVEIPGLRAPAGAPPGPVGTDHLALGLISYCSNLSKAPKRMDSHPRDGGADCRCRVCPPSRSWSSESEFPHRYWISGSSVSGSSPSPLRWRSSECSPSSAHASPRACGSARSSVGIPSTPACCSSCSRDRPSR